MTYACKMLAGILGSLVLGTGAVSAVIADSGSPYQGIVDRNVFGLKPPPPPPDPESIKPPAPKFYLTGISTILGTKRALIKTAPQAKPGDAGKEQSYMLSEGERNGELEVVQIDEHTGIVRVKYGDAIVSLDFTNNAAKAVAVAPVPPIPGAPGTFPPPGMGIPAPTPGVNPALKQPVGLPPRQFRPTGSAAGYNPASASAAPMPGMPVGYGMPANPQPGFGQPAQPAQPGQAPGQVAVVTREQQEVLMELLRDQHKDNPAMPPMPPTSLTSLLDAANQEGAAANTGGSGQGGNRFMPPPPPGAGRGGPPPLPTNPF